MKRFVFATWLCLFCGLAPAAELSGVFITDEIKTADGQSLVLNGAGLREKLWVDVYVGSLYLPSKSGDVAEILSKPGPWRVQLDIVYKEVSQEKLLKGWREGFEKNQDSETNIDYYLQDLASTNGTQVNGEAVSRQKLNHDDVIRIGWVNFKFIDETKVDSEQTAKIHKSWIPGVYYTRDQ